ncbi:hypothetical protein A6X20_31780 [Bradyrhizobium elkanii]|nr:hypothetical protein A6X20_31780 [Bradyrhizobium elkanii]ODM85932.1 hypothetical protein A6452_00140 [Bradyrhizobium elkanii]
MPDEITNAVVINSYYSGDSTDMYEQWVKGAELSGGVPIIGPGRPIDTDRYYVVMVDPLGTWGVSKLSHGLGIKFPQYTYYDMVQANYRMLRDHLKVARVALAAGVSMGGTQTYVWGVMHPEYVSALMLIGGTTQSDAGDPVGKWPGRPARFPALPIAGLPRQSTLRPSGMPRTAPSGPPPCCRSRRRRMILLSWRCAGSNLKAAG